MSTFSYFVLYIKKLLVYLYTENSSLKCEHNWAFRSMVRTTVFNGVKLWETEKQLKKVI